MASQDERLPHFKVDASPNTSPTYRCTDDVLMCIFELAVEEADDGFVVATTLSHVCHTWRQVAISMPRIWDRIIISFKKPIDDILAYLERTLNRVKSRPVSIGIDQIDAELNQGHTLRELNLNRFTLIDRLLLMLCGDDSVHRQLIRDGIDYSDCPITELEIHFINGEQMEHAWHGYELVSKFPSVESLTFYAEDSMYLESDNQITQIRRLGFCCMDVPLLRTLWCFPQLESLVLADVQLYEDIIDHPAVLVLERLNHINITTADHDEGELEGCLGHINTPNLTHLLIQDYVLHNWLPFITRHPSITHFGWCSATATMMSQLSEAAPQLKSLGITILPGMDPLEVLQNYILSHFIHLHTLNVVVGVSAVFPLRSFETLVTGRCLPSSHPNSRLPDSIMLIRELTIITASIESQPWVASELYLSAAQNVKVKEKIATTITLSWAEL